MSNNISKLQHIPAQMDVTTVIGCSIQCRYCPQQLTSRNYPKNAPRRMTLEVFSACIAKLPKDTQINFSGFAEPFHNPVCVEMVLLAHDRGHPIALYTTLSGLDAKNLLKLSVIPFVTVDVHLPSMSGGERIETNPEYKGLLGMAIELLDNVQLLQIQWSRDALLDENLEEQFSGHDIFVEPANSRAGNWDNQYLLLAETKPGQLQCDRNLRSHVLLPNGDVALCCQDFGLEHILGNLMQDDYKQLLSSDEFQRVVRDMGNPSANILCRRCKYSVEVRSS